MTQPLAAVILDSLAAPLDPELDRVVGPGAAQRLRRELRGRARRWVAAIAPDRAFEATTPGAALMALDGHGGPVILVAPDIPVLGDAHTATVVADLGAGADLIVGATHDASAYLLAFALVDDELIELAGEGFTPLLAAASARNLSVAIARHERRLATVADARALAADPLAAPELVQQLGNLRPAHARPRHR